MSPTEAVVYIPDGVERDGALYARRGVVHIERRGYRFNGVLRKLKDVLEQAAKGAVVVFARQEHAAAVSQWQVKREFVGEETCRLVPIVQAVAAGRAGVRAVAAPYDESPTVAILERRRAVRSWANGSNQRAMTPLRAAQIIEETARRWGHGTAR